MPDVDVVIVGAGLAGLCAARHVVAGGRSVLVLEAGDDVGGRVRTDEVDGFLLDRGFQLYNPAYPEGRRMLDHSALRLQRFVAGVLVSLGGRRYRLADPRRQPGWSWSSARAPVGSVADRLRLARLAVRAVATSGTRLTRQPDATSAAALIGAGLSSRVIESVLRPFLAGVFLEADLETSRRFLDLVLRSFVLGTPALPSGGMRAIPRQLASRLPVDTIRLHTRATEVRPGRVVTDSDVLTCAAVLVATDPATAHDLLREAVPPPRMNSVTTWYHAPPEPPIPEPALIVDGQHRGPVVNTCVISNVCPSYAPAGRSLVSSSVLDVQDDTEAELLVRRHLALLYGADTTAWELVGRHSIADALPSMPPPHDFRRPVRLDAGLYVAGDHRDSSSIQGAMVSGRRAARAILKELDAG